MLHRAAKRDAFFELIGNAASDQERVDLGLTDLLNGDADAFAGHGLERAAQLLDLDPALADHDSWFGGVNGDSNHVGRALDLDLRDTSVLHAGHDVLADFDVFQQQAGVFGACREPTALPVLD